jgi:hypothetical protein
VLIIGIVSTTNPALAGTDNKTLVQPQGTNGVATDSSNVILVHGGWADVFENIVIISYDFYNPLLTIRYMIGCKISIYGINRNDRMDSTRFHTYIPCLGTLYSRIETSKIDEIIFTYSIS